jgi:hypothetical protein
MANCFPNRVARRLRAFVLWAMVPVAAFGGRPVLACICVDGSYKPSCPMLRDAIEHNNRSHRESACCAHRIRDQEGSENSDCCHAQTTTAEPLLVDAQCCHPVVQAPVLPPVSDVASVALDHQLALDAVPVEADSILGRRGEWRVDDDTGLPTPDLVVTLRRLVI